MGVVFPDAQTASDHDRFDLFCEHPDGPRKSDTDRVVGTYRILTPGESAGSGRLLLAVREFDLSGLSAIRDELRGSRPLFVRTADYRSGAVIMLLWFGLAEYLRRGGYEYVLGCASVSSA